MELPFSKSVEDVELEDEDCETEEFIIKFCIVEEEEEEEEEGEDDGDDGDGEMSLVAEAVRSESD
jgi:hypothetical protein